MSDVDVMAALIEQHAESYFPNFKSVCGAYRASPSSSKKAAKALYDAGFRMQAMSSGTNEDRLRRIEDRLTRLEGWAGLPCQ